MRDLIKLMMVLLVSSVAQSTIAQDIHFSNIHASPVHLNPAMTGIFNGGSARFIGISRSQWTSFTNGFKTISGSIDAKILQTGSGFFGGGLQVFSDKAGDLDFKQTYVGGALSYVQPVNKKGDSYFAAGFQAAYIGNSFDLSKMVGFDTETSITFGDVDSNINYLDVSAGAAWYYTFNKNSYYYIGAAMHHINKPNVSFFDTNTRGNTIATDSETDGRTLFRKVTIHGGAQLKLTSSMTLLPSFVLFDQGPHRQMNMGTYFKIQKAKRGRRNTPDYAFYFGAWVRWYKDANLSGLDAVIPSVRADFKNTIVSLSFDVNISDLKVVSNGAGGPELSIIKVLGSTNSRKKSYKVKCPDF